MARITRYTPAWTRDDFLWPMTRLHQEMNRLFTDTFRGLDDTEGGERANWMFSPVVDVEEQEDRYEITAELPGVSLEDVNVEMEEDMLVISGSKERKTTSGEGGRRQSERIYGSFRRAFRLPDDVQEDQISARFLDGVLTVSIPRSREQSRVSSRRIQIESSSRQGRQSGGERRIEEKGAEGREKGAERKEKGAERKEEEGTRK